MNSKKRIILIGIKHHNFLKFLKIKKWINSLKPDGCYFFLEYCNKRFDSKRKKLNLLVLDIFFNNFDETFHIIKELEKKNITYKFIDEKFNIRSKSFYDNLSIKEILKMSSLIKKGKKVKHSLFIKHIIHHREKEMIDKIIKTKFKKNIDYYVLVGKDHVKNLRLNLKKHKIKTIVKNIYK